MKTNGNTILITGGGSGIGEALAHRFHDAGNKVIVAGRRQDVLDRAVAGRSNMSAMTLDIADPAAIVAFAHDVIAAHPDLNVLINNAGMMRDEAIDRAGDVRVAEDTITTNLLGPIRLTNALVEQLTARGDGVIVNVTSGLAFVPLTLTPTYCATKAAMHSYSVSLRELLRGRAEVIELAPPGVQTDLTPGQATREGYQPLAEFADEVMALFTQTPTPSEILVERVRPLRFAEAEGQFEQRLTGLNAMARKAREGAAG